MSPIVLIVIDDDEASRKHISATLSTDDRLAVFEAANPDDGFSLVLNNRPRIVLLSSPLGSWNGIELLRKLLDHDPGIDVILMTAEYSGDAAVEAIKSGACDCISKPVRAGELQDRVAALIAAAQTRQRTLRLDRELTEAFRFEGMVGRSPLMLDTYAKIDRIARHFRTVLVSGATGTGKELAARALHVRSSVHDGPFVPFNCAAVADTLVESELFGHVKGAFTGAVQDRAGLFEYADGGTVFLDEIGDMAPAAQAKLLRIIQNQEFQRVGSPLLIKVDVRIIAATNRDLHTLIQEKQFREDLYYRLATVEIRLPKLADRKEDLPILQRVFVERFSKEFNKNIQGISRRAQAVLNGYTWPGNVRELENALAHACMMSESHFVDLDDLPDYLREPMKAAQPTNGLHSLEEMGRRYARRVVTKLGGNKLKAAEVLGISRAKLYRMLAGGDTAKTPDIHESNGDLHL